MVLFEMLCGKRCFDGKSATHIIMRLLEDEPDWTKLPANVPSGVRHLLERCLQKDPAKRLRDVGDLRLQLEAMAAETSMKPVRQRAEMQAKGPGSLVMARRRRCGRSSHAGARFRQSPP